MKDPAFKLKTIEESPNYGKFAIEPLEKGYGNTLGNALRRVLLSSLKGAAITNVKFESIKHPFSTIAGMKEDMVEFILNLKKVRLQLSEDKEFTLTIDENGPKILTAADIETPSQVTIVNKDLYLANLSDKKAKLDVKMVVNAGFGYLPSEEITKKEYGEISVDALFSPVLRVNYKVEETRVGRVTNMDKLIIEVWTDGTIDPLSSIKQAAKILASYFLQVFEPKAEVAESVAVTPDISEEILKMTIEELDLPMRVVNSLKNGSIETVGQLLGTSRDTLKKIKNLGEKSLKLIDQKLKEKGVSLSV